MKKSAVLIALAAFSSLALASEDHFSQTIPAQPDGKVTVWNVSGSVELFTWDKPELGVEAEIGDGVDRVEVSGKGASSEVRVVLKKGNYRNGGARLKVNLPAGSRIESSVTSGTLALHGPYNSARLQITSGNTTVEGQGRELDVRSVSGNVLVSGGPSPMKTRIESVSGTVRVRDIAGELDLDSTSGSVDVNMSMATRIRARATSGKLGISATLADNASLEADSTAGGVDLKLAGAGGYRYDLSTFGGGVSNCVADGVKMGTVGNGSSTVRVRTFGGRINFCDKLQ